MKTPRSLAILSYHKIGRPPEDWWSWFYVPEDVFARQLRQLCNDGWDPIDAPTFLRALDAPQALGPKSVLITFDDAYRSFRRTALPWLRRLDFPAIVFVPTDYVGRRNSFDDDVEPPEQICGWADLRDLANAGISIQSHTASHRAFSELGPAEQKEELVRSKQRLEDALDSRVDVLAYPYGDAGKRPADVAPMLVRAGYRAACTYGEGVARLPDADRFLLPRIAMGPDTDLMQELAVVQLREEARNLRLVVDD